MKITQRDEEKESLVGVNGDVTPNETQGEEQLVGAKEQKDPNETKEK